MCSFQLILLLVNLRSQKFLLSASTQESLKEILRFIYADAAFLNMANLRQALGVENSLFSSFCFPNPFLALVRNGENSRPLASCPCSENCATDMRDLTFPNMLC
ncbi:hypothetical protein AVEN_47579-1 [Araneus ventricosus]|uniref:Secreted protein n=1 Tax=Araneus ventricosus TaxID=182803 RepID=A0A4Y2DK94_ARAVE|nr:hypothetical protein AVEN_47579-1 [Araneus ventricosus]